jgi:hypothetical protein
MPLKKKKDDDNMEAAVMKPQVQRKKSVRDSYAKLVKQNGKALERLSKK